MYIDIDKGVCEASKVQVKAPLEHRKAKTQE
jgi:hypothetical protein